MTQEWQTEPEDFPAELAIGGESYPNMFERAVRVVMHAVAIIALVLASLLLASLIRLGSQIGDAVDRVNSPGVLTTGCPAGDGECGG